MLPAPFSNNFGYIVCQFGLNVFFFHVRLSMKFQLLMKSKMLKNEDVVFTLLITVKMTTMVGILTFLSKIKFMLI